MPTIEEKSIVLERAHINGAGGHIQLLKFLESVQTPVLYGYSGRLRRSFQRFTNYLLLIRTSAENSVCKLGLRQSRKKIIFEFVVHLIRKYVSVLSITFPLMRLRIPNASSKVQGSVAFQVLLFLCLVLRRKQAKTALTLLTR